MLFGLSIGNIDELKQFKWMERFKPDELHKEVVKFKELLIEGAFLVRVLFFLLLGYLIQNSEFLMLTLLFGHWELCFLFLLFAIFN